jgi:hypothetical protein
VRRHKYCPEPHGECALQSPSRNGPTSAGAAIPAPSRPTHFPSSPLAAGVTRVLRFQPEIRGESYLAPGKVRQGVRTCGLKPQDTSSRTACCCRRSDHMIGVPVSSSSAKADSFAAE